MAQYQTPVVCSSQQTASLCPLRGASRDQRQQKPRVMHQQALRRCSRQDAARVQLRSSKWSRKTSVCAQAAAAYPFKTKDCRLVLEDGSVWKGTAFGAQGTEVGEVVFNTSITGYQEIMTDPSYKGQFVCFTHPHIGNVGINDGEQTSMYVDTVKGLQQQRLQPPVKFHERPPSPQLTADHVRPAAGVVLDSASLTWASWQRPQLCACCTDRAAFSLTPAALSSRLLHPLFPCIRR